MLALALAVALALAEDDPSSDEAGGGGADAACVAVCGGAGRIIESKTRRRPFAYQSDAPIPASTTTAKSHGVIDVFRSPT